MIYQKLKGNLPFLNFNLIIPLVIPSLVITGIGLYCSSNYQIILFMLFSQVFLFNTIMLSTNIGLLNIKKERSENDFDQNNTALSTSFIFLNIFLLMISLNISFSRKENNLALIIFLIVISIIFLVITSILISKNDSFSFLKPPPPSTTRLAQNREKTSDRLRKEILEGK